MFKHHYVYSSAYHIVTRSLSFTTNPSFMYLPYMNLYFKPGLTLLICLSSFLAVPLCAQSGFTKEQGDIYAKADYGGFSSADYYDLNGARIQTDTFSQRFTSIYLEYGVIPRFTLILDWPAYRWQGYSSSKQVQGIGDLRVGLKWGILGGKFPLSLTIMPEFPIGPAELVAENLSSNGMPFNLPTGDGEFNLNSFLSLSHSFYPIPAYLNLFLGYNLRTQYQGLSFQDQLSGGGELGAELAKGIWARVNINLLQSLGSVPQSTDFVRGEGTSFSAFATGLTWMIIPNLGVDLSFQTFFGSPIPRRNVFDNRLLMLGLVFEKKQE